ncbi:glycosyltransferase involved in cell wall biosynthesis [Limnobacter thiooxidans]|uniref:Glycosyltransferase family 4 protein n=1 Tax=Limnobacter thiooxidans TaxID=131080 RepID=A0AA86J091_9BURK|nr:glycosyltransferase family 4 protein [Limnobacter sp.]MCZ8014943.1 glycosyltransferase family 4 protein [Limnobacter sp.]RZS40414.1 glycosyltransferase involved in cell wall biosynthesis [Limnobacter thiooxidans]BET27152.1 glycosyltransferase family 4 protein [Limnobacter thiooxidans]
MTPIFFSESSKNIGGQELQLLEQAVGLKAKGYTPYILCRAGSRISQEAHKLGLNVEYVPFRNAIHPPSVLRLANLVRRHKPVAVVCHSSHDANLCSLTVHTLAKVGLLKPRPMLIRMRTYQPGPAKAFTYNQMFDQTFTPSQALKDQLLQNSGVLPEKVGVLYPGIDFERIVAAATSALPAELDTRLNDLQQRPVIVHAAMFRVEKGHSFMLQVVKALLPRFPNLLYVAAGEGETRQAVETEAQRLGLLKHVVLPGMLNPVAPLIKRADVLVMPSSYEPLGMSQIEALGLGVPVVVSNVGGLPETVQSGITGYVCPAPHAPGALDTWVQALTTVLGEPQKARDMAAKGQQAVVAQFGRQSNINGLVGTIQTPRLGRN